MDKQLNTEKKLLDYLRQYESICIAYSGGVDSTLLLSLAAETHPEKVAVVIGTGAFVPEIEAMEAIAFTRSLGLEPVVASIDFLNNPLVASNPTDRCFHCKYMIFEEIIAAARIRGIHTVMDGTNTDDLKDFRPGLRALKALNVVSPFVETGTSKADIRALSQARDLPTWNKPALSCLASRIPTGEPIQKETLKAVELGEALLQRIGLRQYRLRIHGDIARIEAHPDDFELLLSNRIQIIQELKILGFRFVTMDLEGYQLGSMNTADNAY